MLRYSVTNIMTIFICTNNLMTFFIFIMKAIDRLYIYLESQNIKPTVFEREIGFSSGYLSNMKKRKADMGESIMNKVIDYCHLLSAEWLLIGNGDMIKNIEIHKVEEPEEKYKSGSPPCEQCIIKDELIKSQKREIDTQGQFIKHLVEADSPIPEGQKRKESSSDYGNSKLSEAI